MSFHGVRSHYAVVGECLYTHPLGRLLGKEPASPEFHQHKFQSATRLKFCGNRDRNLLLGGLGECSRKEARDQASWKGDRGSIGCVDAEGSTDPAQ